ncbi:MAG: hypothetical protein K2M94_02115 [Paramuribaculum sp.]|nr:hypothetical protein [Paramuribaculum sp.]
MRLRLAFYIIISIVISIIQSCGGSTAPHDDAVPRPHSYPRLTVYPPLYSSPASLPCHFQVNSHVNLSCTSNYSSLWADAEYPMYHATLRCTFTPIKQSQQAEIIDNRLQRMGMNLGDNAAEQTDIISADSTFNSILLRSSGPTVTPLQFLSTSPYWVISGALDMPDAAANVDSVRPLIDAVYADLVHALVNLSGK